jgi:hypothetical protein
MPLSGELAVLLPHEKAIGAMMKSSVRVVSARRPPSSIEAPCFLNCRWIGASSN